MVNCAVGNTDPAIRFSVGVKTQSQELSPVVYTRSSTKEGCQKRRISPAVTRVELFSFWIRERGSWLGLIRTSIILHRVRMVAARTMPRCSTSAVLIGLMG